MNGPDDAYLYVLGQGIPQSQDNPRVLQLAASKRARLRSWMAQAGFDGVVISRRDDFAWLTGGGDNRVLNNSEVGVGHLVVTAQRHYLVSHSMDASRLLEEQAPGQGYEPVELRWFQGDPRLEALKLAGRRAAADTCLQGTTQVSEELALLHHPLEELEIDRLRWLARKTGNLLEQIARHVQPGMTEAHIARQMQMAFTQASIDLDVLIVGSDERIFKFRHPLPTEKHVEKYVLLHPAARRWGLHANVSRSLHFGRPDDPIRRAYRAAASIEGRVLALLKPGLGFAEILEHQKAWYGELGYPDEWQGHFQGGPTAYRVVEAGRCLGETRVLINQAFDWFITVTGAKVEELSLLTAKGVELASLGDTWPVMAVEIPQGQVLVPDLMVV